MKQDEETGTVATTATTWPFLREVFLWSLDSGGGRVTDLLSRQGVPVLVFRVGSGVVVGGWEGPVEQGAEVTTISGKRVLRVEGHVGRFRIWIEGEGGHVEVREAGLVLIHGQSGPPVEPGAGIGVPESSLMSLEEMEALGDAGWRGGRPDHLGVWLDPIEGLPDRVLSERALRALLGVVREAGVQGYVLFRHVPLWGLGGQPLYDALRAAGVRFFRIGEQPPVLRSQEGRLEVEIRDAAMPDRPVSLWLDKILVVGQPYPQPGWAGTARTVGDPLDAEGFLQAANVHLYPARSFRKGIYYLGPCKGEQAPEELSEELGAILGAYRKPLATGRLEAEARIRIDRGRCVSCLTCYRACPHHALDISQGPVPVPVDPACEGCGLCAALCPGSAIELVSRPGEQVLTELEPPRECAGEGSPPAVVFYCRRMRQALGARGREGRRDALEGTPCIELPCACAVTEEMLVAAFLRGAGRVILVGCHPDNCASRHGPILGPKRMDRVATYLRVSGLRAEDCLRYLPASPNEGSRLAGVLGRLCSA